MKAVLTTRNAVFPTAQRSTRIPNMKAYMNVGTARGMPLSPQRALKLARAFGYDATRLIAGQHAVPIALVLADEHGGEAAHQLALREASDDEGLSERSRPENALASTRCPAEAALA